MRKTTYLFTVLVSLVLLVACESNTVTTGNAADNTAATFTSYSDYDKSADGISYTTPSVSWTDAVYINLTDLQYSEDNSTWSSITDSKATLGNSATIKFDDTEILVNTANFSGNPVIHITGAVSGKSVAVKPDKSSSVKIVLDNASITSGYYPCIRVKEAVDTWIEVADGTTNTLVDGREYGNGYGEDEYASTTTGTYYADGADSKGTLFSKGNIFITGTGTLNITEGYKHGIASKSGYIRIFDNTTINIATGGRDGIRSANGFIMDNGTITINGTGSHTDNESKGIVVEGYSNAEGFIIIKDGTLNITTVSKGITAKWKSGDDTEHPGDEPDAFVLITGGTINVTTTGTPYENNYSTTVTDANGVQETITDASLSPEGIEGKANLYIFGGTIVCETTDDCINVSSTSGVVQIAGGFVFAHSSENDAIDSNGRLEINGGVIVAWTTAIPECAFDCDDNTFSITGGTLVGIGTGNYSKPTASSCSQGVIVMSGSSMGSSDTVLAVKNSGGDVVFAYRMPVSGSASYVGILSSPNLSSSGTYSVVYGSTASGGSEFNGLYTTLPSISGGSTALSGVSFSSSYVYTQSGVSGNGPQEGPRPSMPGGKGIPGRW